MKKWILLWSITAVLLVAVSVCYAIHMNAEGHDLFEVEITVEDLSEVISSWIDEEGNHFVFLPGYADLSDAKISLRTGESVCINGTILANEMYCDSFRLNTPYEVTYETWGRKQHVQLTFLQSASIATMYIETQSESMDYIHAQKGNGESGITRLYTVDGDLDYSGEVEKIGGHGNATWEMSEKKPYSLTLAGEANLLGMGKAQRWILLANAYDESHMRNKLVYDFADDIGLLYSPDSEWCDLYLNGEYAGLYLLCERNEVHCERVNIGTDGGALVSLELEQRLKDQGQNYVLTDEKQALRIHYADETLDVSGLFQSIENAVMAEDGIDAVTGMTWIELIEEDSWVKKTILEEIFGNFDSNFISQYFYVDGNDTDLKVYAGPVWDYDNAIGNRASWQIARPTAFLSGRRKVGKVYGELYEIPWVSSLYLKDDFSKKLCDVFENEVYPRAMLMIDKIIIYGNKIKHAALMNQIRWNVQKGMNEESVYISEFLKNRMAFLRDIWIEKEPYCQIVLDPVGEHRAYWMVKYGESLQVLPALGDNELQTFLGWFCADTGEPFDTTKPIYEDTEIYAKWQDNKYKNKKLSRIIKHIPLVVIAVLGVAFLIFDIRRGRKGERTHGKFV